ncbi:hypothetical protein A8G07_21695 [Escherichia coli]|nr:hypothetical protein A8G07_21695 [Escherichia coli]
MSWAHSRLNSGEKVRFVFLLFYVVVRISPLIRWPNLLCHYNAMEESINGLYKTEVIHRKSWKNRAEVELATLTWVDWYNNRRLLKRLGHIPPTETEKAYYASIGNNDLAA